MFAPTTHVTLLNKCSALLYWLELVPLLLRTRSQMIEAWARKNLIIENLEVFIDAVKNLQC